jgi:cytoskeletal protein RodZ
MKRLNVILAERREELGYSLEKVAGELKIKKEFLEAIEDDRYGDLPSDTYAAGFVKNYGTFLGVPEEKTMALFRRDYKTGKLDFVPSYRKKRYARTKSLIFSLKGALVLVVMLSIVGYLIFQFSSLFLGPKLVISEPKSGAVISSSVVQVKGETDPYATLEVNGEETSIGLDGSFKKALYVFSGSQVISVTAKNRFGKATVERIRVNVK